MSKVSDLQEELRKPFPPSKISWKPGIISKDKGVALGLAYADLRAYMDRLDDVCGMDWSITYSPWGERIVCHLTIAGVTRSSTGEMDKQSEGNEIGGTSAESQAAKRAAAMFGAGRYLYSFPSVWAEYDVTKKCFTEKGQAKLDAIVVNHYNRFLASEKNVSKQEVVTLTSALPVTTTVTELPQSDQRTLSSSAPSATPNPSEPPVELGSEDEVVELAIDPEMVNARAKFSKLGQQLYGTEWPEVCCHNVARITGEKSTASDDLTLGELQRMIDGMEKLQAKRVQKAIDEVAAEKAKADKKKAEAIVGSPTARKKAEQSAHPL